MSHKPFSRTVQDLGNGCPGASLPSDMTEEYGIDIGDELPYEIDPEDGTVTFYLRR